MPKVERESPCVTWDVTLFQGESDELPPPSAVANHLTEVADKWCFQKEQTKEGRLHYQIRIKFKPEDKKREAQAIQALIHGPLKGGHVSRTSKACVNDMTYVQKTESRVEGPWTNESERPAVLTIRAKILMEKGLRPWQQKVVDLSTVVDLRKIYYVMDPTGNAGKTSLYQYMKYKNMCQRIPTMKDAKDLMRMVMDTRKRMDKAGHNCYIIDIPRDVNMNKLGEFFHAIETVKDGYAYDDRYRFEDVDFDPPAIFVFCNTLPPLEKYTADRWVKIDVGDF